MRTTNTIVFHPYSLFKKPTADQDHSRPPNQNEAAPDHFRPPNQTTSGPDHCRPPNQNTAVPDHFRPPNQTAAAPGDHRPPHVENSDLARERCHSSESSNSICTEFTHFRPIRRAPVSPRTGTDKQLVIARPTPVRTSTVTICTLSTLRIGVAVETDQAR